MIRNPYRRDVNNRSYHRLLGIAQISIGIFTAVLSFFGCIFREQYSVFGNGFYLALFLCPAGTYGYLAATRNNRKYLAFCFSLSLISGVASLMGIIICSIEVSYLSHQYLTYRNNPWLAILRITNEAGQYQMAKTALLIISCFFSTIVATIQTTIAWRDLETPEDEKMEEVNKSPPPFYHPQPNYQQQPPHIQLQHPEYEPPKEQVEDDVFVRAVPAVAAPPTII